MFYVSSSGEQDQTAGVIGEEISEVVRARIGRSSARRTLTEDVEREKARVRTQTAS